MTLKEKLFMKLNGTAYVYTTTSGILTDVRLKTFSGQFKRWAHDGQLITSMYFKDGLQHGIHKGWYHNGQLEYVCKYKNGERHGSQTFWYQDNTLMQKCTYLNGLIISWINY